MIDTPLRIGGGLFMLFPGSCNLWPADAALAARSCRADLSGTVATTFALTMINPMTIPTFAALFAGLGLAGDPGVGAAGMVVTGVFPGSPAWWIFPSGGVALSHRKLPPWFARRVSQASGVILVGFGCLALLSAT